MEPYEENELYIYNSLSGRKEKFTTLVPGRVGMYVCGPTVYSNVHLGNCRTFISFDMVFRYLSFLGYKVRYVRNITDAGHLENDADQGEDKIAKKARLEALEPMEIVQRYTDDFHCVLRLLGNRIPSIEPTATGHIIEQIGITQDILDKGYAYVSNGSVYFDVEKYNHEHPSGAGSYGELSGRNIDELLEGTRALDGQNEKRSPRDFALWKKASPYHIMHWPSPWGEGFPGWHMECSAMSTKYLGETFDIHGGGMDLKFPHHECEIAQNQVHSHSRGARYWMHANMLTLNGRRMSKSTGNILNPRELFSGENDILKKAFPPAVVRFFIMQAHYRSVLDFSSDALEAAEKGYYRLMEAIDKLPGLPVSDESTFDVKQWRKKCYAAMNDDFNTPVLLSHIFEAVGEINKADAGQAAFASDDKELLCDTIKGFVYEVMGIENIEKSGDGDITDGLIKILIEQRLQAREERNWALSDQIRDRLAALGISLKDGRDGTTYSIER